MGTKHFTVAGDRERENETAEAEKGNGARIPGWTMGNEMKCMARINGQKCEGTALLETSQLIFRGSEGRVRIAFAEMKSVTVEDGELRIKTHDRAFALAVGAAAEKWRKKILYPRSRMEKLGVKAGRAVALLGAV